MPVGTQATVKAQLPQTLLDSGTQVVLANTYHLLLRPGPEVLRRMGGIHRFMSWPRAVLTDSGGYQVFSLPGARSVSEEGATFRSYVDHRSVLLSPESSIETQVAIGGDIMMAFDHCVASTVDLATARAAADLTARWAVRCLNAREAPTRGDSPCRRRRDSPLSPLRPSSASCRAPSSPTCGASVRRASPRCRSTATRSAAWRWARAAPSARTSARSPPSRCRRRSRGT